MNCQEVMDYMQRQLDGDLDERETEILMTHTRHCPECAAMMERLEMLSSGLTSLPKVTPSYSLVDAILPRLAELQAAQEGPGADSQSVGGASQQSDMARRLQPSKRKWTDRFSMRAIGGVIAAGVIVGLFIVNYNPNRSLNDSDGNMTASSAEQFTASDDAAADTGAVMNQSANTSAANEAAPADEVTTETTEPSSSDNRVFFKSTEERNVDPNGETMPPLAAASDQNGEPTVKGNSPNFEVTGKSGGSEETDSANTKDTADNANAAQAEDGQAISKADDDKTVSDKEHTTDKMAIAPVPASPISKDEKYQAFIVEDSVRIYTVQDSLMVFSGEKRTGIANLHWSDDSSELTYEAKDVDGVLQTYSVDLKTQSEQLKSIK
ncbi:anti-sigma factor family protein [Paenibacillus silvisoli]|uniref:anti-sigma factor family protein n=1 Tax=Paenibacillus silvisoli TaxID=3110539 RepID=UPI0028046F1B|nr:zf-HC2 domain-containing protein [Paenibacillus silvisoli]